MNFRLVALIFLSCMLLANAETNEFLDRNQVLINVIQDEGVTEFSRFLERPDLATLDGEPVPTEALHSWLQQYLGARTLVSGELDDFGQDGVFMSLLNFEEQDEPLALEWVQLKGGQYYLRGVQAPRPVSRLKRGTKPEFVKNPNRQGYDRNEFADQDSAQFPGGVNLGVNGLSLPGVDVNQTGVYAPGVDVTPNGIYAPGVDVTPNGIYTDGGVQISPQGVSGPGFNIGAEVLREISRGGFRGYRGNGANTGFRILRSIFR